MHSYIFIYKKDFAIIFSYIYLQVIYFILTLKFILDTIYYLSVLKLKLYFKSYIKIDLLYIIRFVYYRQQRNIQKYTIQKILPVRLYKRLVALTCCFFTLKNNIFIHRRRLFHTECSFKKYSQGSQFKVEIYHFKLLFKRKYSGFFMFDK